MTLFKDEEIMELMQEIRELKKRVKELEKKLESKPEESDNSLSRL